jgi:hypothetical protein
MLCSDGDWTEFRSCSKLDVDCTEQTRPAQALPKRLAHGSTRSRTIRVLELLEFQSYATA